MERIYSPGICYRQWFNHLGETTRDITQVIDTYRYMHPEDRTALLQFIDEAAQGQAHTFGDMSASARTTNGIGINIMPLFVILMLPANKSNWSF